MANEEVFGITRSFVRGSAGSGSTSSSSSGSSSAGSSTRSSFNRTYPNPGQERKRNDGSRKNSQEQDIVKQGHLHIKRPPNSKMRFKAWQKKFFILRDMSFDNGVTTLEMYDSQADYESNTSKVQYMLDLKNVNTEDNYSESRRFPRAFMVLRSGKTPLVFGTTCDIDKSSWMETIHVLAQKRRLVHAFNELGRSGGERRLSLPFQIQHRANISVERAPTRTDGPPTTPRNNSVQSNDSGSNINDFITTKCAGVLVRVQQTISADKNRLVGDYYMNVWPGYMALTDVQSLREKLRWPIEHITKFKSEDLNGENLVTLEASIYCGQSEGLYLFKTTHGRDLIRRVQAANCSGQETTLNNNNNSQPSPSIDRHVDHPRNKSCTPNTPKMSHLFPRHLQLTERSSSSPNLREVKTTHKTCNTTVQRDVTTTTVTYKSNDVTENHEYLALVDDEKNNSCFNDSLDVEVKVLDKEDLDYVFYPDYRDSDCSDTLEEDIGIYVRIPALDQSPAIIVADTDEDEAVVYSEIQTKVDCRPPLPPKTAIRNQTIQDVFLNHEEELKSLPQAPPVPVRQTKL